MDQSTGGTRPTKFAHDRVTLLHLMDRFCTAERREPHPLFQEMSERDWLRWAYLHMDHHLRQFGV